MQKEKFINVYMQRATLQGYSYNFVYLGGYNSKIPSYKYPCPINFIFHMWNISYSFSSGLLCLVLFSSTSWTVAHPKGLPYADQPPTETNIEIHIKLIKEIHRTYHLTLGYLIEQLGILLKMKKKIAHSNSRFDT